MRSPMLTIDPHDLVTVMGGHDPDKDQCTQLSELQRWYWQRGKYASAEDVKKERDRLKCPADRSPSSFW
jgi:hypothetical protein